MEYRNCIFLRLILMQIPPNEHEHTITQLLLHMCALLASWAILVDMVLIPQEYSQSGRISLPLADGGFPQCSWNVRGWAARGWFYGLWSNLPRILLETKTSPQPPKNLFFIFHPVRSCGGSLRLTNKRCLDRTSFKPLALPVPLWHFHRPPPKPTTHLSKYAHFPLGALIHFPWLHVPLNLKQSNLFVEKQEEKKTPIKSTGFFY